MALMENETHESEAKAATANRRVDKEKPAMETLIPDLLPKLVFGIKTRADCVGERGGSISRHTRALH
jgi:hypothetical protein